jgi:hypothetical protein
MSALFTISSLHTQQWFSQSLDFLSESVRSLCSSHSLNTVIIILYCSILLHIFISQQMSLIHSLTCNTSHNATFWTLFKSFCTLHYMFRPTLVIIRCLKLLVKTAVLLFCGSDIRCVVPSALSCIYNMS